MYIRILVCTNKQNMTSTVIFLKTIACIYAAIDAYVHSRASVTAVPVQEGLYPKSTILSL